AGLLEALALEVEPHPDPLPELKAGKQRGVMDEASNATRGGPDVGQGDHAVPPSVPPHQPEGGAVHDGVEQQRHGAAPEEAEVGLLDEEDDAAAASGLGADQ